MQTYLGIHQMSLAFPSGLISHDQFVFQGKSWRLLSRRPAGPFTPHLHLAVLDGDLSASQQGALARVASQDGFPGGGNSYSPVRRSAVASPHSRPLVEMASDEGAVAAAVASPPASPRSIFQQQRGGMQMAGRLQNGGAISTSPSYLTSSGSK